MFSVIDTSRMLLYLSDMVFGSRTYDIDLDITLFLLGLGGR